MVVVVWGGLLLGIGWLVLVVEGLAVEVENCALKEWHLGGVVEGFIFWLIGVGFLEWTLGYLDLWLIHCFDPK